jgi:hypothetical protein
MIGPPMVGARDKRLHFLLRHAVYLLQQELHFGRGWITRSATDRLPSGQRLTWPLQTFTSSGIVITPTSLDWLEINQCCGCG